MKNNTMRSDRILETVGTLVLTTLFLSFFLGCAAKSAHPTASPQPLSIKETTPKAKTVPIQRVFKKALDSTVHLVLKDAEGKPLEIGSGFFVRPGLIVTNLHVMEGAVSGYAKLIGQETQYPIENENIVRDENHGLALLNVAAPGVEPLSIETVQYRYGTSVYTMGNLSELGNMFSEGIVTYRSVDNRTISISRGGTYISGNKVIQGPYSYAGNIEWFGLTIQISRGSSGGPVLNSNGKVIGVSAHRGGISGKTGNFAISSNTLTSLLRLQRGPDLMER